MKINGERHCLWRAMDHEGEDLEKILAKTRDKKAVLSFREIAMRKLNRTGGFVTDRQRYDGAAFVEMGTADRQETGC